MARWPARRAEALTFGRSIAEQLGVRVRGAADRRRFAGRRVRPLRRRTTVHVAPIDWLTDYSPEVCGELIAAAAEALSPSGIVACGTDRGNEMLAHAAAVLDLPFVANCLEVKVADAWEMTRVQWGGSLNEDAAPVSATSDRLGRAPRRRAVESTPVGDERVAARTWR